MHTVLDTLAALDPVPGSASTDAEARRRDAMLERILAAPRAAPVAAPTAKARRGARRLVFGAAAIAVAVPAAVAGGHLLARQLDSTHRGLTEADLAAWVSTSTPRTPAQLSDAAKQWCTAATDEQAGPEASTRILGGDERNAVASMLIERAGNLDLCLADKAGGGGYWELVSSPANPLPTVSGQEVLLQSAGEHGSNNIGTAWGQVGTDVSSVTLRFDGRTIDTTVIDGIWNAWWPDATGADLPTAAVATYTDGRTATVPVRTP